jgi:glycosyltransferase involved in cell wall biosynthesis
MKNKLMTLFFLLLNKRFRTLFDLVKHNLLRVFRPDRMKCLFMSGTKRLQGIKKSGEKAILVVDHHNVGGSRHYINNEIKNWLYDTAVVLRFFFNPGEQKYYLEIITKASKKYICVDDIQTIYRYLSGVNISKIFVNHLLHFPDPYALMRFIGEYKQVQECSVAIAVHDYYAVCPSFNLLNDKGVFCHIPEKLTRCDECLQKPYPEVDVFEQEKDIRKWRSNWQKLFNHSDRVLLFSNSSKALLLKAYPSLEPGRLRVLPHKRAFVPKESMLRHARDNVVVGVLGNISYAKGAGIIKDMLDIIEKHNLSIRIVVIGEFDVFYRHPALTVTGRYLSSELDILVEKHAIDIFFISSVCPETFSYTTEEAISMQYPVICFDIGAPAERVAKYEKGHIVKTVDGQAVLSGINCIMNEEKSHE